MRWLIVTQYDRPGHMGVDFADALRAQGREVRLFAYRRDNPLYKNRGSKTLYQRLILRRLARAVAEWRPSVVLVIKGGPIPPDVLGRLRRRADAVLVNVFPDNPLWMIPFECIEAYDLFFTKERYALESLRRVGLRNVHYLPLYCVPELHHPVTLTPSEQARFAAPIAFVGSRYPYRERLLAELADRPLRVWGSGWSRAADPRLRALVAGGPVSGRDKLCVYSGATVALNPHHPMNDILGTNTRTFELAAAGACQVADAKDDLATLFKPGEDLTTYRDLADLRRQLDHYLARPEEARAMGENARRRALAEHTIAHRLAEIVAAVESRFGRR
jgi:spore maturation protein CgeB